MKKIEFINDSAPYLSAENLNLLQDNVEESIDEINKVIVSSTEPTTGEEVWLQKGKNLYNPANAKTQGNNAQNILLKYEKIKVGETYTFSTPYTWVTVHIYNSAKEIVRTFGNIENSYEQTFTIQDGEKYFTVIFYSGMNNVNLNDFDFTNVQLEQGNKTSYEPYINKKIHTKTDNGYEEFYNEEEVNKVNYSTNEQRIGTWINGKPLYRKTIFREVAIEKDVPLVINSETNDIHRIVDIRGSISSSSKNAYRSINTYNLQDNKVSISMLIEQNGCIRIYSTDDWDSPDIVITFEYTKTTD